MRPAEVAVAQSLEPHPPMFVPCVARLLVTSAARAARLRTTAAPSVSARTGHSAGTKRCACLLLHLWRPLHRTHRMATRRALRHRSRCCRIRCVAPMRQTPSLRACRQQRRLRLRPCSPMHQTLSRQLWRPPPPEHRRTRMLPTAPRLLRHRAESLSCFAHDGRIWMLCSLVAVRLMRCLARAADGDTSLRFAIYSLLFAA